MPERHRLVPLPEERGWYQYDEEHRSAAKDRNHVVNAWSSMTEAVATQIAAQMMAAAITYSLRGLFTP